MFIFPRNWSLKALPLLCSIIKGVTYTKADLGTAHTVEMIPILRANNINKNKLNYDELVWIRKDKISPKQFLQPGDIIIATSSGSKNLVGKAASFFDNKLISCGAFCSILRPNHLIDQNFFKYFFQTQHYRRRISETSKGSNINNLRNQSFSMISIPVPPMAEQKRIVKKIEELFAVIDKNIQKLEHTQQFLIQYRISILHTLLEKSHKTTGKQVPFSTVIKEIIGGGTPAKSNAKYYQGQIPFMTVKDMTSSRPTDTAWHITQEAVANSSTNIIPANTLIIATRVGLGKVVQMSQPVAINQDLKGLILRKNIINQRFFEYVLHQKTPIILRKSRGTTVKGITLEDFKDIQFFLPSLPEQKAIVEKIEKAFACADKAQAAISVALEQAKQLKQSILKRAFEGRLVPQDPNDKPVDLTQLTPKGKTK